MSTDTPPPTTSGPSQAPRPTPPDRVRVTSPAGAERVADVVDAELEASVGGVRRILTVEVDGVTLRYHGTDVDPV